MSIVGIVLVLIIVGFLVYMLTSLPVPIHPWFRTLIVGVIFIAVLVWILNLFGINTGLNIRMK